MNPDLPLTANSPSSAAQQNHPIGVFDSGIGGLTVVAALRRLLPHESILYIGDTARVPYGGKTRETIEQYSLEISRELLRHDAKIIVVACNTATALALPHLKEKLRVPVIGVIRSGARAAVSATRNGHIGVIGTRATIASRAYEHAIHEINPALRVTARACPIFVPLIEEGWLDDDVTKSVIARYLSDLKRAGIDTLVLGCTHYPLLKNALHNYLGDEITLVDSAENCARAVLERLSQFSLTANSGENGALRVALTDASGDFLRIAEEALDLNVGEIQRLHLGDERAK